MVEYFPRYAIENVPEWELDLLTAPAKRHGSKEVAYTYNPAKGTVYSYEGYVHRDFGRVVKLGENRFLAAPNRAPRKFSTVEDAINYLL